MSLSPDVLFRALSDETRLRCLLLIRAEGELCVCELTHALDLSQPKVSRHLAYLREAGIVDDRRSGLWVHYRLHPNLPRWVHEALAGVIKGIRGTEPYRSDRTRLAAMPNRPEARCSA